METYPNKVVTFHTSDIILCANTYMSYLTEPEAHSNAAGYFFLWIIPSKFARDRLNGPIHINCNILNFVAAFAAEAETEGCFVTGRYFIVLRNTL